MNKKKYEILYDQHKEVYGIGTVYRIYALTSFGTIAAGTLGGWVQDYNNLNQEGDCWIDDDAIVCNNAKVKDNARVSQNARIFGHAMVCGHAIVDGSGSVGGISYVSDFAEIHDKARVCGDSSVLDSSLLRDNSMIVDCIVKNNSQLVGETFFRNQKISETPIQMQIRNFWCYKNPEGLYSIGVYSFPENDLKKMLKSKKTFMEWDYFKPDDYEVVLLAFALLSGKVQEAIDFYIKRKSIESSLPTQTSKEVPQAIVQLYEFFQH